MNKCFICKRRANSFIFSKKVCRIHYNLILKLKRDKALWKIIRKLLGDN